MIEGRDAKAVRRVVGAKLREVRRGLHISQRVASDQSGIAQAALSNYEAGLRDIPLITLLRLCRTYGLATKAVIPDLPDA